MEKRVVITGMGIWSCLGTDLETVKNSLYTLIPQHKFL